MVANTAGKRSAEDLTARARIRDAALRLFAERGLDGTTIRDIAKEAGVSGGLIRHHFGSKDDLRAACDSYALDQLMRIKEQAVLDGQLANPAFMSAAHPTVLLTYRYLARSLVDGSPAAEAHVRRDGGTVRSLARAAQPGPDGGPARLLGGAGGDANRPAHDARPAFPLARRRHLHGGRASAAGRGADRLLFAATAQPGTRRTGTGDGAAPPGREPATPPPRRHAR